MNRRRLAIICTHPVQYYAPLFRQLALSSDIELRVFYTWPAPVHRSFDSEFGIDIQWDIPLLDGYAHEFVPNIAGRRAGQGFMGTHNPTLIETISRWGADTLLVYGWNHLSHLQAMRYFKGRIPVLFRGDSTLLNNTPTLRTLARRAWLSWVYRHIDVAISVGQNSRDYFAWCGIPAERIAFAPHCIDNQRFATEDAHCTTTVTQWRHDLGIPREAFTFVFAAKLIDLKAPLLLLDAFLQARLDAHLVFVGNGVLEDSLREAARPHARVHLMPFQNQSLMPAVYRLADVFVLPSTSETWGLALNEAMACGRSVIASTRVGATRDLVQEDITGWSFPSGDRNALTQALHNAVAVGKQGLQRRGENAQHLIERWSVKESARCIVDVVQRFPPGAISLADAVRGT